MADQWFPMVGWDLVLPPSRPWPKYIDTLQLLVRSHDINKACVLGSTPEFRDALYESGVRDITIIDRSDVFYERMSEYRVYHNDERFEHTNWLDCLEKSEDTFDVVLSHLTHGNLSFDEKRRFFDLIRKSLTIGGVFFDVSLFLNGNTKSIIQLLKKYETLPLNIETLNSFNSECIFRSDLIDQNGFVDPERFYSEIKKISTSKKIERFVEECKKITPEGMTWSYSSNESASDYGYLEGYELLQNQSEPASSAYHGVVDLYVLEKL